jgi:acyl-[acyl-carrier-protein]-phospholipid O-acyltransferase/long-chain-fatty-acid--[acyl-carrier-protein] ligase
MGLFQSLAQTKTWGRLSLWILNGFFYRLKIVHSGAVPTQGPLLLVCNHVSHLDGLLVAIGLRRKVTFLVWKNYLDHPLFGWLIRSVGALPIGTLQDPITNPSIARARSALLEGEAVCIFAEGVVSRTGSLHPFKQWYDRLLEGLDVPILPVHLDSLGGGLFDFRPDGWHWKGPGALQHRMTLSFGNPLPSGCPSEEVRLAVMELGTEAWEHRRRSDETLATRLMQVARRHPFRLVVTDTTGARLTYARFMAGAYLLARWLQVNRPREGRVGLLLPATAAGALANGATVLAGRTAVNLNFTLGPSAMDSALRLSEIRTIFTSRAFLQKSQLPAPPGAVYLEDLSAGFGALQKFVALLCFLLGPSSFFLRRTGAFGAHSADPAVIVFSSGSTAVPKGVVLTHHNILSNIEGFEQMFWITKDDCMAGILPFFHSFGFTTTLWFPLLCGFRVAYHPNPLDAKGVGDMVRNEKATFLLATPSFMQSYIKRCEKEDFASLKYPVAGAEKLRREVFRDFHKKFGMELLEGYGCTEMSPVLAANCPDYFAAHVRHKGHKPGTVGQPLPGVSVKVVDPITREHLSVGLEGLLLVKGPNRMKGYLRDPAATRDAFHGDWYVTGDLAVLDADGFLTLTGRLTRFSKIGGEMVPHGKIEHSLMDLDHEHAYAVTGVSDFQKGERLIVVHNHPGLDIETTVRNLRQTGLPNLWVPKMDSFYFVEKLPLLGSGKLDLRALHRLAENLHHGRSVPLSSKPPIGSA